MNRVENQKLNSLEKDMITLLTLTFTVPLLSGDPAAHYSSFDGSRFIERKLMFQFGIGNAPFFNHFYFFIVRLYWWIYGLVKIIYPLRFSSN